MGILRIRIVAASTALLLAGAVMLGSGAASAAGAEGPASGGSGAPELAPLLQKLVDSGADPSDPATAARLSVAASGPGSLQTDAQDRVTVTVTFRGDVDETRLAAVAGLGRILAVSPVLPKVTVAVPTSSLPALAAIKGVRGVAADLAASSATASAAAVRTAPASAPAGCRSIPVDVDPGLKSDAARARFGVDGTGVTVGIVSTSFNTNTTAATTEQQDIAMGVLPGPGNPCGYTHRVEVLPNVPQPASTDEGRGMAQMVHGVAPGARMLFASGLTSPSAFALAVTALTDAGADIIVDDLSFSGAEPMFQEGELGLAIDYAVAHGVLYVSAAGNYSEFGADSALPDYQYAIGGWESTQYVPTACPAGVAAAVGSTDIDCHNFGTTGTPDATNTIFAANAGTVPPSFTTVLNWAEPINGVTGNLVPVLIDPATGDVVGAGARLDNSSPISAFVVSLPSPGSGYFDLVIVRERDGYAHVTPGFKLIFPDDEVGTVQRIEYYQNTDTVTVGPNIFGHAADANVLAVGAANWQDPQYNEAFSSLGPVRYLFGPVRPDGAPSATLAAPETRSKPDLTSLDAAQTSFFEPPIAPDGNYYFSGTSAASPNAAGVAALAMQYSPQSTADEVKRAMLGTAGPMLNAYRNMADRDVSGAGLVNALATLEALPPAPSPTPKPTALAATGASDDGELGWVAWVAGLALAAGLGAVVAGRRIRSRSAR